MNRKPPINIPVRKLNAILLAGIALASLSGFLLFAQAPKTEHPKDASDHRLAVVWSSADPDVAHRVCLMYTHAAQRQKWFDRVELIVWGPSARLLAADKDLQAKVKSMMKDGVEVRACVVCADSFGVSDRLSELGLEVKAMGSPLTDRLKEGWKVLTF